MKDAISKITKSSCQIALVKSANILKGVITDGDIRRAILQGKSLETKSKEIMQKNFVFLNEKKTSKEALRIMRDKNLRQIPQLDKNGRIINLFLLLCELFKKAN
jgi:CBS domain-containing protein